MVLRLLGCALVSSSLLGCAWASRSAPRNAGDGALADAVAGACKAQIVFLGEEGSHGGGRTFQIKTAIVRDLIRRCGFTHVAFESQIYDFIDLQQRYARGSATRAALYDAIGGLWSRAAEIDPLVDLLHEKALARQLTVSGFDGQTGGATGYYTQTMLGQQLGGILPIARREFCSAAIGRLAGWKFDGANPKDSAFDTSLLECAREIEAIASANADRDSAQHRLARSFRSFLEFSPGPGGRNDRDRLMYENFAWQIARLRRETKTIVWTATVHGLRKPQGDWEVMASHAVRHMSATIHSLAVVATSGSYAAGGKPAEIVRADTDSLEGEFAPTPGAELAYIDSGSLSRAGTRRSRVLSYGRYADANWGEMLDGVLVLASEVPPTYIRPRTPMQAASK